jgi:ABC-type sugar transport system ATPase subunit
VLVASGLSKTYGGVHALRGAGIRLDPGEIHALVGENGAGKSTMVKILSGVVRKDAGTISIDERPVDYHSPRGAATHGIAIVSQELSLFPDLTVAENLFPQSLPRRLGLLDFDAMERRARPVLSLLGLDLPTRAVVGDLSLADQQLLEICRALLTEPKVLILDEPTSALPAAAVARLEKVLHEVAARGIAVLYISHFLEEVRRIADRVSVLRDGEVVLEARSTAEVTLDDLVTAMLGVRPEKRRHVAPPLAIAGAEPSVTLEAVNVPGKLIDVDLTVVPGEIVGLAGLEEAGHLATVEVICGLARPSSGSVRLPGGIAPKSLRHAIASGLAFVPGDRKKLGLMLDKAVWENATSVSWLGLSRGSRVLNKAKLVERATANLERMQFHGDVHGPTGDLSGGNQQKVVFAKWVDTEPSVIVLDDPTRGVDVGARGEMHEIVRGLAAEGRTVLLTTTDLDELVELCHRVAVFQRGRKVAELVGAEISEASLSVAMNAGFVTVAGSPGATTPEEHGADG